MHSWTKSILEIVLIDLMGHNVNGIKLGPKLHHIPNFMA
jgi:hypothetical protein